MEHMPWLLERSSVSGGQEPSGHTLMASCPPEPFSDLTPDIPFGSKHGNKTTTTPSNYCQIRQSSSSNKNNDNNDNNNDTSPTVSRNFSRNGAAPPNLAATTCDDGRACALPPGPTTAMDVKADTDVGIPAAAPARTWELSKADLATLLDLSQKLNLDGEITPVMAWGMVLGHPRLGELVERDFVKLREELRSKARCYG